MSATFDLTDDAIREAFERRAQRATALDLRAPILAKSASTSQARRGWDLRGRGIAGGRSSGRILAAAVLVGTLLAVGLVVIGGRPETPEPTPAPLESAAFFARPFEYRIPAGSRLSLVSAIRGMMAFTEGDRDVYARSTGAAPIAGSRGITISAAQDAVTHPCPGVDGGASRVPIHEEPVALLDDLRRIAGIGLGEPTEITFDGRTALSVRVDPSASRCEFGDFHVQGGGLAFGYVLLTVPSDLIVTVVDGRTVVFQVWAASEQDLETWRPMAAEFLGSVHFTAQP